MCIRDSKYTRFLDSIKKASMDVDPRNFEYIDNGTYSKTYSDFSKDNFIIFGKKKTNQSILKINFLCFN